MFTIYPSGSLRLQSVHEGRIYQLKLFCDTDYPEKPPTVRFQSQINMTCVNQETGVVITIVVRFVSIQGTIELYLALKNFRSNLACSQC